jgi:hypothetical protein
MWGIPHGKSIMVLPFFYLRTPELICIKLEYFGNFIFVPCGIDRYKRKSGMYSPSLNIFRSICFPTLTEKEDADCEQSAQESTV